MKHPLIPLLAAILVLGPFTARAQSNAAHNPASLNIDKVLDLKIAKPEVSVNLPRFLLLDAVSDLDLGTNSPFAAAGISLHELVKDIQLIRFLVISTDNSNQDHVDKAVSALRKQLEAGWTPVFAVEDEGIGVYVISDPTGEAVGGVALLIHGDDETIIGNIVGRISIGKLIKVASQIDRKNGGSMIPKDLIEKLANVSSSGGGNDEAKEPNVDSKEKKP